MIGEVIFAVLCNGQENYDILPSFLRISKSRFEQIRDTVFEAIGKTASSPHLLDKARRKNVSFICISISFS